MPPKIIENIADKAVPFLKGEFEISAKSHPEIMAVYEGLIEKHGIKNPPPVFASDTITGDGPMDYDMIRGRIRISHECAENPPPYLEKGFAHELGHYLGMHKPIDQLLTPPAQVLKTLQGYEKEADRIGVSLTGDAEGFAKVRGHFGSDEYLHRGVDPNLGFFAKMAAKIKLRLSSNAVYGSPKQAERNIQVADHPANDSFVSDLIRQRNAGYDTRTSGFADSIERGLHMQMPDILARAKADSEAMVAGFKERLATRANFDTQSKSK